MPSPSTNKNYPHPPTLNFIRPVPGTLYALFGLLGLVIFAVGNFLLKDLRVNLQKSNGNFISSLVSAVNGNGCWMFGGGTWLMISE
jgi:hypothetical protein